MDILYHQLKSEETLKQLQTQVEGLSSQEVEKRQQQYGRNSMPQPKPKSLAQIFLGQFLNPLIYVLIGAAILALATGDAKDAIFIVCRQRKWTAVLRSISLV